MNLQNPHNDLFGFTFNDKQSVITFIKNFLPKEIRDNVDYEAFHREDTTYVTKEMKTFYADKVWSTKWGKTDKSIKVSFLFEHKSQPENPWLQLIQYLLEGYRQQILEQQKINKANKEKRRIRLTAIIPILFYHGEGKWQYRKFEDYFDLPDPYLKRFIPNFDYLLTDLANYSDKELLALEVSFLLSTLLLLKHKSDKTFIQQNYQEIFIFVEQLKEHPNTGNFLEIMILYLFRTYKLEKQEVMDIVKDLPTDVQDTAMTTYEIAVAEGEKKGMKKGETIGLKKGKFILALEIALDLLVEKLNISNQRIAKITKLPVTFIKNIRTHFQQKELAKANEVVLKAFKKISALEKIEIANLKKLVKKHYLKFQKKQK